MIASVIFIFGAIVTLTPLSGHAQFSGPSSSVNLSLQPRFPAPNETVTIALEAYTIDTTGSEVRWFIDGREQPDLRNQREITHTAGDLGESDRIRVVVQQPNGQTVGQTERTITPTRVDLIFEPQTITPTGYRGAALPSVGSRLRVVALPHEAAHQAPANYTYRWSLNGEVLFRGANAGQYTADMTIPEADSYLTVDVFDQNGQQVASETTVIPTADPTLHFYIDNPLRGRDAYVAGSHYDMRSEQLSIHAAPYFLPDPTNANVMTEWEVDGRRAAPGSDDPFSLTVERQRDNANVPVSFRLQHLELTQHFQGVRDTIVIRF